MHFAPRRPVSRRDSREDPARCDYDRQDDPDECSSTLDEQHDVGVLPNWDSHYGYDEQMRRFATTTPDVLAMGYAMQPASGASVIFDRRAIEKAKDATLTLTNLSRGALQGHRIFVGVDVAV